YIGIIWALLAMLSWAGLMTFETLCMERGTDPNAVCMYEGIFSIVIISSIAISPALFVANISSVFAANGVIVLLPILGFGLITTVCAYYFYMHALNKVLPTYVEICYSLDPTLACIWGLIFFGQKLSALQFLGIAIVLGAVIFEQVYEMRAENKRISEEAAVAATVKE
ncbi:MAG: DMT family transporter, partial [Anaerovorax sp.]